MELVRFSGYTHVEVEPNDNTPMMVQQVYKNIDLPFPVSHVRLYEGDPDGELFAITGWSSADGGKAVTAYAVQVDDSSAGTAYLVYGGDWGIRLQPSTSEAAWSVEDTDQIGETHLVLSSLDDLTRAER